LGLRTCNVCQPKADDSHTRDCGVSQPVADSAATLFEVPTMQMHFLRSTLSTQCHTLSEDVMSSQDAQRLPVSCDIADDDNTWGLISSGPRRAKLGGADAVVRVVNMPISHRKDPSRTTKVSAVQNNLSSDLRPTQTSGTIKQSI